MAVTDTDKQIARTYKLIREVMRPVLTRMESLMLDLTIALGDSQRLQYNGMNEIVDGILQDWAKQLVNPFGMDAPKIIARQIVRVAFGDYPPPEFWISELGGMILEADGFPDRGATQAEAAMVLRVTQQAVSKALREGRLTTDKRDPKLVSRAIMMRYSGIRRRRFALTQEAQVPVDELA